MSRDEDKKTIIIALHDESGHRGRDVTTKKILERYWRDIGGGTSIEMSTNTLSLATNANTAVGAQREIR